jgi:type I restriction enzyme S subunit
MNVEAPVIEDSNTPSPVPLPPLPPEWRVKRFRHVFSFNKGLTITKEDLLDEGVPCVNYGEIHSKYGFEVDPERHPLKCVDSSYLKTNPLSLLRRGDFIFADTSEDIDGSGNFTCYSSDREAFAGYHTIIAKPKVPMNARFMAYLLDSKSFRVQVQTEVTGVKVFSISQGTLKPTMVWFPPDHEQNAIAAFLDEKCAKVDEAVRIKEEQIALLCERRQIQIEQAITRGLNPSAPMKDSGVSWIGHIPAHWEVVRLKRLFRERNDRSTTGEETLLSLRMNDGLVPHDDVSDRPISAAQLKGYKQVFPGQIVMNRMRASIGIFGMAPLSGIVSPDYAIFDVAARANGAFFLQLFKTRAMGQQFRNASRGLGTGSSGFMRLYTDDFGAISVALPPLAEQSEIVLYITNLTERIGDAVRLKEEQIAALKEYKTTLINAAVTGKIKMV